VHRDFVKGRCVLTTVPYCRRRESKDVDVEVKRGEPSGVMGDSEGGAWKGEGDRSR